MLYFTLTYYFTLTVTLSVHGNSNTMMSHLLLKGFKQQLTDHEDSIKFKRNHISHNQCQGACQRNNDKMS